jgi:hypothetical protein
MLAGGNPAVSQALLRFPASDHFTIEMMYGLCVWDDTLN